MVELDLGAKGLSRKAGLNDRAVSNILDGSSESPRLVTIQAIAKALNCTVGELLGEAPPADDNLDGFLFDVIRTVLGWGRDRGIMSREMTDADIDIIAQALTRSATRGRGRDQMRAALDDAGDNIADLQRYRSAAR